MICFGKDGQVPFRWQNSRANIYLRGRKRTDESATVALLFWSFHIRFDSDTRSIRGIHPPSQELESKCVPGPSLNGTGKPRAQWRGQRVSNGGHNDDPTNLEGQTVKRPHAASSGHSTDSSAGET